MACGFTVPRPKRSYTNELPTFNHADLEMLERIGHGSYGNVTTAIYRGRKVVLKQPYDATNHEKEFIKEARLLHSLLGNRNIVEFIAISSSPSCALMQKYMYFLL